MEKRGKIVEINNMEYDIAMHVSRIDEQQY